MTVGFHAPLPPAATGVADYATGLLTALRKRGDIQVNAQSADVHLYHLGNNQLHRKIYGKAIEHPGVAVLHDAVLHHFYLGAFDQQRYIEEFVYNYGAWDRALAESLWRERAASGMDQRYFRTPMLKRIGERSLAVVVHNSAAAQAVRDHAPAARIIEIPHFFEAPPLVEDRARLRADLAIGEDAFVFGVFGYLRESKRIVPILRCFERVFHAHPRARLLLAGSFASQDLERAVAPSLSHPGVIRLPWLNDAQFWNATAAVDCCLNLRYPGAGETSGIGVRLMGLGKVVFFTEGPEIANLPLDSCIRISPRLEESAELFDYMKIVLELPEIARAIGTRAAAHIRDHHSLHRIADGYWDTLCVARESSV